MYNYIIYNIAHAGTVMQLCTYLVMESRWRVAELLLAEALARFISIFPVENLMAVERGVDTVTVIPERER